MLPNMETDAQKELMRLEDAFTISCNTYYSLGSDIFSVVTEIEYI